MKINTVNQTTIPASVLKTTPTPLKTMRSKTVQFNEAINMREIEQNSKLPTTNKQKTTTETNTGLIPHWTDKFPPGYFVPLPKKYLLNKEYTKSQIEQDKQAQGYYIRHKQTLDNNDNNKFGNCLLEKVWFEFCRFCPGYGTTDSKQFFLF